MVSGFLGALSGGTVFVYSFYNLTNLLHSNMYKGYNPALDRAKQWDFRVKNLIIYGLSDMSAAVVKTPFEVRK